MKKIVNEELNIEGKLYDLKEYYKNNNEFVIIGLNDSQGVNTTTLFRKGLLEYIADSLKDDDMKMTVINAFSLMFNKTEHINYLLSSNPNLNEIRDLQIYGMVEALKKVFGDFHMPKCLGKIGYVSKTLYRHKESYEDIKITDTLKNAKEPIVIYSCGANDLMREGWNNPFSISKDYKKQNDAYKYTLEKLSDPVSVKKVINKVEGNINNILSINDKTDIFTLGLYIPKSMTKIGMEVFIDAIDRYNEFLRELCDKYNLEYIDTESTALIYNKSKSNYHVTTGGHQYLSLEILDRLYDRKFYNLINKEKFQLPEITNFPLGRNGLYEMLIDLKKDLNAIKMEDAKTDREKEVFEKKSQELERQVNVVEKVLMKRM